MQNTYLKKVPLFQDFSSDELDLVKGLIKSEVYRKKMIIFMEGDPGIGVHFVKSGIVKIYKISEDGREQILHFLREGDVFAEVVLFDGGNYPASAEAVEDCQVGILRNQDLEQMIVHNPAVGLKMINVMGKKIRAAHATLRNLALKDSFGRVVATILELADRHGVQMETGIRIDLALSRQDLANYVGSTRETVTRILTDLKRSKTIQLAGKQIIILDKARLENWL